jgi:formyl-CoA transferase
MQQLLTGVRVLELTTMITGSLAGSLLGDLGASIIKVERPGVGDPFRGHQGGRYSGYFVAYNRNKRSATLDLQTAEGKEILSELIRRSDVLIDNFRIGVLDRLGLNKTSLDELNPRLIHASITGFGPTGPYTHRPAYDAISQSLSGILSQFLDTESPQPIGPSISDNITGYYGAYAILAALYERDRTKKGRRIEINMLEATIGFAPDPFINRRMFGTDITSTSRVIASQTYAFRCRGGALLSVHLSSQQKFWEGLVRAVEAPEMLEDPRFAKRSGRMKNYIALRDTLAEVFAKQSREYWEKRLEEEDVPYAPVLTVDEVFQDEQIRHLGTFYDVTHPTEGATVGIESPLLFDGQRAGYRGLAPGLGEHTDAVLAELGKTPTQIEELKAKQVV